MRFIDRLTIRSAKPLPPEELRTADAATLREQRISHYIHLARFMADCGVDSVAELKASEKREYDRRKKAIDDLSAAIPQPLTRHEARMRLLTRSNHHVY